MTDSILHHYDSIPLSPSHSLAPPIVAVASAHSGA